MAQRTWFITGVNSDFGRLMTERLFERETAWPERFARWTRWTIARAHTEICCGSRVRLKSCDLVTGRSSLRRTMISLMNELPIWAHFLIAIPLR